ncbi:GNAT family N-acetyltransferase [Dyadobacter sandarakinus]|uniref:GNAT family N-acetyltransferase n=1 Tax=Dyadobacter sandarakinus TaxID=2747268 RepID=A0ABX7I3L3_9BACT|nr:GNAT family N-acetyltransferase [Dyadobacter sandarakinus]QRR00671.1 GNAT family N-acetyltransferase [Dyadobacter sandarakinus]
MSDIIIREARAGELPALLAFEQGIIEAERPFDETFVSGDFHYYNLEVMIANEQAAVIVAELNGELIGSGNARIMPARPYNHFKQYAFLGFMYVQPAHRGKGINSMIIAELVRWAYSKGLYEVRLQVYAENAPAIAAYEKVGFKKHLTEMRLSTDAPVRQ